MPGSAVKIGPQPGDVSAAIDAYTARHEAAWIDLRRRIHRHPEPSGEESDTSELVRAHLAQHNIPAHIADRGVGVTAELLIGPNPENGPVIALRADIDALRMHDRKSVEYASTIDGCAHACGHDVHTTIMLAVSETLAKLNRLHEASIPSARIRLLFQAAEEICKGAQWMVDDGAMEGVDAILGIHVDPLITVGQIGVCYGPLTAHVDEVVIEIEGRGGHSARPHDTSDPVAAAAGLVTLLYQSIPRHIDARDPNVFTIGQIHGGTAPNVIPDQVRLNGTLRCVDVTVRNDIMGVIRSTCNHFGRLTGNQIEARFCNSLGSVRNAEAPARAFEDATRDALGGEAVEILTRPSMGGEDFAVYLDHAPGAQVRLGCAGGPDWPLLHSPVFDVDERVISIGTRVVTRAVLKLPEQDQTAEFQI